MRKGFAGHLQIAILLQLLAIETISCVAIEQRNRNFTSVFGDRTSFRAKRFAGRFANRNFTSVFGDRNSFRAKGLRLDKRNLAIEIHFVRKGCVSCRLVGIAPRLQERNRKEGKRARGQESKRAREQEGKRECEDVKM